MITYYSYYSYIHYLKSSTVFYLNEKSSTKNNKINVMIAIPIIFASLICTYLSPVLLKSTMFTISTLIVTSSILQPFKEYNHFFLHILILLQDYNISQTIVSATIVRA